MKKNLLVTLADVNYIDQAKQLFSSAYWNAGWQGDYMLLAHEIPENKLNWFREKGIMVKKCKPLYDKQTFRWPSIVFSKLYIFTQEFKKWEKVIYLDADMIVRASLEELLKVKIIGACKDESLLENQFKDKWTLKKEEKIEYQKLKKELKRHYKLKSKAFNTGMIVFNTKIISQDTLREILKLLKKYEKIVFIAEQPILNLAFYKKWEELPNVYNLRPKEIAEICNLRPSEIKGIIIHSYEIKPWNPKSVYYKEWLYNLRRADGINLKDKCSPKKWSNKEVKRYTIYLNRREILFYPRYFLLNIPIFADKNIGRIGVLIRSISPRLYLKLKLIKDKI